MTGKEQKSNQPTNQEHMKRGQQIKNITKISKYKKQKSEW